MLLWPKGIFQVKQETPPRPLSENLSVDAHTQPDHGTKVTGAVSGHHLFPLLSSSQSHEWNSYSLQGAQTEPTWSPYKFKVKYRQHFQVSSKIKNDSKAKSQLIYPIGASLIALLVKNPPAMQENPVQSLGWEDPLEKGKATHSSILAWRISWTV